MTDMIERKIYVSTCHNNTRIAYPYDPNMDHHKALARAIVDGYIRDPGQYIVSKPDGRYAYAKLLTVVEEPPQPPQPKLVIV